MSILNQSRRFILATADFFVVFLSSIFVKILIQFLILGLDADYSALIVDSLPLIAAFSGLSLLGMIICRNYHVIWRFATIRDLIRCIGGVSFGAAITAIGIRIFSPTANKIGISWNNIYFLTITFLIDDEMRRLAFSDIECITILSRKVIAIDKDGVRFSLRERLRDLEETLPSYFIRINRSALANEHRILRFDAVFSGGVDAVFQCGYREYVSRRCFAEIRRRYEGI